jgi:hypothetical protein
MKANQLATLVLRLLGIYCLIQIVPTVVALSTMVIIARTIFAAGIILKTALGLWMFFGARGFANLWRTLQNFGTPNPSEQ